MSINETIIQAVMAVNTMDSNFVFGIVNSSFLKNLQKNKCPSAVRHWQSDIYDLTFSMGYPARSAGYMFCYNRSMIHLASVFSGGFFGREEEDFDLTQGDFCIMVGLPLLSGVVAPIHWRYRSRYQNGRLQDKIPVSDW